MCAGMILKFDTVHTYTQARTTMLFARCLVNVYFKLFRLVLDVYSILSVRYILGFLVNIQDELQGIFDCLLNTKWNWRQSCLSNSSIIPIITRQCWMCTIWVVLHIQTSHTITICRCLVNIEVHSYCKQMSCSAHYNGCVKVSVF